MPSAAQQLADQLAQRYGVAVAGRLRPAEPIAAPAPGMLDPDRVLPVHPDLATLLPDGGLRRGSVVTAGGSATLALALPAAASAAGAWCAVVGMPSFGVLAAAELGWDLDRLALVPNPGRDWSTVLAVLAALVDTLDLVVLRVPGSPPGPRERDRLTARLRERGAVLVVTGPALGGRTDGPGASPSDDPRTNPWPGAELRLRRARARWHGLGDGAGRLTGYELRVEVTGRGTAARPRRGTLHIGAVPPPCVDHGFECAGPNPHSTP